jgi:hypothetical protein
MMFMHALAPMLALLGVLVSFLVEAPATDPEDMERDGQQVSELKRSPDQDC